MNDAGNESVTVCVDRWSQTHLVVFNRLLEQQVGVCFLNARQRITFANASFAEKLGREGTVLVGTTAQFLSVSSSLAFANFPSWIDLGGARASTHGALQIRTSIRNLHLSAKSFIDATDRLFRLLVVVEMSDFAADSAGYVALRRDLDLLLREP